MDLVRIQVRQRQWTEPHAPIVLDLLEADRLAAQRFA
jgi:hypothetical protein